MRRTALLLFATLLLAGCQRPATLSPVPGTAWPGGREFGSTSVTESGAERPLVAGTRMTVRFGAPGELQVEAGCNQLGVRARLDGERLVPYSYLSTAIGCASELLDQDRWVVEFFNAGPAWRVDGDELTLRSGTTEIVLAATR